MSDITWTPEELREFDRLIDELSSRDQVKRINARIEQNEFVQKHGKEKCDAMWAYLQQRDMEREGKAK